MPLPINHTTTNLWIESQHNVKIPDLSTTEQQNPSVWQHNSIAVGYQALIYLIQGEDNPTNLHQLSSILNPKGFIFPVL